MFYLTFGNNYSIIYIERGKERNGKNERGFFANLLAYKGIENINEMVKNGNIYVVSASPNIYADIDKKAWLKKYIPNLKNENILLCRNGQNKAVVISKYWNLGLV